MPAESPGARQRARRVRRAGRGNGPIERSAPGFVLTLFVTTSYGFRPNRRAQDAIAEVYHFVQAPSNYEYVVEGDIEACFDRIDHGSLMARIRKRVGDHQVLTLVKATLKAGVLTEAGTTARMIWDHPRAGSSHRSMPTSHSRLSIEHFERAWRDQSRYSARREYLHRTGRPTYRLIRYADDFVVVVKGTRGACRSTQRRDCVIAGSRVEADPLSRRKRWSRTLTTASTSLAFASSGSSRGGKRAGLYLPESQVVRRRQARREGAHAPSTRPAPLRKLLAQLNPILRGWTAYFRFAASKRTFAYLCKTAENEQPFRRTSYTQNGRIRTVISATSYTRFGQAEHRFRPTRTAGEGLSRT